MTHEHSSAPQPKLGFLVEGDVDKLLVEVLARKVASQLSPPVQPRLATVRLAGTPRVRKMISEILFLVDKGYTPAVVVFDTDTVPPDSYVAELESRLAANRVHDLARLVPVIPCIEAWVLADEAAVQQVAGKPPPSAAERADRTPKEVLEQWLGGWGPREQEQVAALLDPERIRLHDASFAHFEQLLQELLFTPSRAPASPAQPWQEGQPHSS
jgi:hypothetical protein